MRPVPQNIKETERDRDLQFIPQIRQWPNWPYLPMKRGLRNEEAGFLYANNATDEDGVIVYLANIFGLYEMTREQRAAIKTIPYKTVAACLDDGWRVD